MMALPPLGACQESWTCVDLPLGGTNPMAAAFWSGGKNISRRRRADHPKSCLYLPYCSFVPSWFCESDLRSTEIIAVLVFGMRLAEWGCELLRAYFKLQWGSLKFWDGRKEKNLRPGKLTHFFHFSIVVFAERKNARENLPIRSGVPFSCVVYLWLLANPGRCLNAPSLSPRCHNPCRRPGCEGGGFLFGRHWQNQNGA